MSSSQADTGDSGRLPDPDERSPHPGPKLGDLRGLGPAGPLLDIGPFDRRVIAVGGIVFAVLMALSARYGFDRDELYFLDGARHLQASYVGKSLPPSQRASAVIFTADYGEAAALNELGRGTGLPTAVSGDNSEWWWGPGNPHATTIVAVAPGPVDDGTGYGYYLLQFFTFVRVAATLSNPYGLHNPRNTSQSRTFRAQRTAHQARSPLAPIRQGALLMRTTMVN